MPIISFEKSNITRPSSSENIFLALIIVAGLMIGYILYTNMPVAAPEIEPVPVPADEGVMAKIEKIKLDFSVFDNILFKELKIFGEIPVIPGEMGRENPFAAPSPVSSPASPELQPGEPAL